jgi:cation diffusion facilitator CzcD-associated flavoprotein CzcO
MSGLCMAMKLLDEGIGSFVIYEQADEVGGTWRDNTYPGLHFDIPSPYYTYSFIPNSEWTRLMPPGGEIQQYMRRVADERGIRPYIRFGTEVLSAEYRDATWYVTTDKGADEFDVLITATGVLRVPRCPDSGGSSRSVTAEWPRRPRRPWQPPSCTTRRSRRPCRRPCG